MPGVKALAKVQMGKESTQGQAVAATFKWPGPFAPMDDQMTLIFPDIAAGNFGGVPHGFISAYKGIVQMPQQPAAFETLPVIVAAGLDGAAATPAGPGSDSEYTYTGTMPSTAAPTTPKTQTIEAGDDQQAEEMAFCFVEGFELSGAIDEAWQVQATWRGRQVSTTTFTASLSLPTGLEEIPFNGTKLYIDASGGTIGTTEKAGTLLSARLVWPASFAVYGAASGYLYFHGVKAVDNAPTLEILFEHDGTAVTEIAAWRAQTVRLIRLLTEGSVIGGTTKKSLTIDVAGQWQKFEPLGEQNGNHVAKGTLRIAYSEDDSLRGEIVVVNALSAMP